MSFAVARKFKSCLTREEFDRDWAEFQLLKAKHQRQSKMQ
jgi:hypothetical protein